MLKFSQQEWLFRWTDLDNGSYCVRIRAEFEKAKLPFNKLVFRAVCEMTVEWLVKARAKHVTRVRAACLGEYTAVEMWYMLQSSDSLLSLWSSMREATGSFDFVKILTSRPEEETNEEKKVRRDLEAMWFHLTHVKTIGRRECEKWCADNKGKRLHQLVTNSDRAYFKLLLEDRAAVYEEDYICSNVLIGGGGH